MKGTFDRKRERASGSRKSVVKVIEAKGSAIPSLVLRKRREFVHDELGKARRRHPGCFGV